jgi:succinyl-diaminopimelate desuccinylase
MNKDPVANFFATYGTDGPLLVFAGHTDVVPVGDIEKWSYDPFVLEDKEGMLYGRGTADMKGSLASMMLMAEHFVKSHPSFPGKLGFLITSGEEGDMDTYGTAYVMQELNKQGVEIDFCVVGEPSSTKLVGDMVRVGRRGSLSAKITLQGKQGHVAYPHLADNPIHKVSKALDELSHTVWDEGNAFFPPTSMQITYIHSGGHASNIIPGELLIHLNFRFSSEQTDQSLKDKLIGVFHKYDLNPSIEWHLSGLPFITNKGHLMDAVKSSIFKNTGLNPLLSTDGGTSDGRFIAPYGVEVIEVGPINATIHQVNECISLADLEVLEKIYYSIAEKLLLA